MREGIIYSFGLFTGFFFCLYVFYNQVFPKQTEETDDEELHVGGQR